MAHIMNEGYHKARGTIESVLSDRGLGITAKCLYMMETGVIVTTSLYGAEE